MHRGYRPTFGVLLAVLPCLMPICAGSPCLAAQESPASQPALELPTSPPGITSDAEHAAYLAAHLKELQALANYTTDPQAKAQACLNLASFALTRGTEPALSRAWPALQLPELSRGARSSLAAARGALAWLDESAQDHASGRAGISSLSPEARRLAALLAMESALLQPTSSADALQAARQADALVDPLSDTALPAWNLLIAACLDRAGLHQDAQLRLQALLRTTDSPYVRLAAQVLQCRSLAHDNHHAAAIALLDEYLRGWSQSSPDEPASQPSNVPQTSGDAAPVAVCTLDLLKANVQADWARRLAAPDSSKYDRQAANQLEVQSARLRRQAADRGPCLMRLLPILQTLTE